MTYLDNLPPNERYAGRVVLDLFGGDGYAAQLWAGGRPSAWLERFAPLEASYAEGAPCEKGETAAKTGCTPADGDGGKGPASPAKRAWDAATVQRQWPQLSDVNDGPTLADAAKMVRDDDYVPEWWPGDGSAGKVIDDLSPDQKAVYNAYQDEMWAAWAKSKTATPAGQRHSKVLRTLERLGVPASYRKRVHQARVARSPGAAKQSMASALKEAYRLSTGGRKSDHPSGLDQRAWVDQMLRRMMGQSRAMKQGSR